ncbi:hypothetical protein PMIN06_009626 [Paraphaeosphaeria minitans]|uniref:CFEM domain protein n=1 Tax=Paraphaeosphaeria minitans TaxID=565426 RepID=A0A9P6GS35_9PLEO|nr:CFEM domain protein [Paraphaeosphaeria minitans]
MPGPQEFIRARRMASPHLDKRATTAKTEYSQPTNVIALTSTFTPPSSCFENLLTMLPPSSFIWNNEPIPAANMTVAACYPSEFLESYTSVVTTNSGGTRISSSIVPAMSPFVCPKNYCTMFAEARNYIACCPSSYQFHPPDTTVDPDRPAYGGTCYSDLPAKTNVPVIAYDEDGETVSKAFSQSASGGQAFAHPIDGWAATSPTAIGCPTSSAFLTSDSNSATPNSSSSSTSSQSSQSGAGANNTSPASSDGVSTGAIVGAIIGGCAALALLVGLVWFLLARRRKINAIPKNAHQMADDFGGPKTYYRSESLTQANSHEVSAYRPEKAGWRPSQLNDGHGAFEMQAVSAQELPADQAGKMGDAKVMALHAR